MSTHQDDKLQFYHLSTLMLDSNIIVEGLPQTLNTFFAQFIIEQKKVSDSTNIALKKVHGLSVTASQLRANPYRLVSLICEDQAYFFQRQIPGTPPYWKKFMREVIAMVKQLGIQRWFMAFSCGHLRWPELFQILARIQGNELTDKRVDALSCNERCRMLNPCCGR